MQLLLIAALLALAATGGHAAPRQYTFIAPINCTLQIPTIGAQYFGLETCTFTANTPQVCAPGG